MLLATNALQLASFLFMNSGAQQCSVCQRWFKSAGGLAVHKCVSVDQPQPTPTQLVLSQPASDLDTSTEYPALTVMACCLFQCGQFLRCFKSRPGFRRITFIMGSTYLSTGALFSMYVMTAIDFLWPRYLKHYYCFSTVCLQARGKNPSSPL